MDLSTDKIPNKMLLGTELTEIAVAELRQMLLRDPCFSKSIAYRRAAFTLSVTFHLGYPVGDVALKSRTKAQGLVEGEAPLNPLPPEDEEGFVSLERDVTVDNPNVARVQHDLPITVQERQMPKPIITDSIIPGEIPASITNPYPEVVTHHLKYDKTQAPKGPDPVDRDVTEVKAAEMGVRSRKK